MNKLWVRLLGAFLVVALVAVGAVALVVRQATETNFRRYVDQNNAFRPSQAVVEALVAYYAENGAWAGCESLLTGERGSGPGGGGAGAGNNNNRGNSGAQLAVADVGGTVQASTNAGLPGTQLAGDFLQQGVELRVDGELAGWLVRVTPGQQAMGEAEARFLDDTGDWLAAAAIGAVALAIFVSVAFAHQLARPLRALTGATRDLAAGALGKQVNVKGADEVVELADAFNQMSHDLAEGEALRRRMTADIAHELRTPISIMRGHLEAMLDGVYPADAEHLAVAHDQTLQLARLVEDLRLLTLAEAGRLTLDRAAIAPGELVVQAAGRFSPLAVDAGLTLTHTAAPGMPPVYVDVGRMHQVLANLLSNALHHTPAGGRVDVQTAPAGEAARFSVSNTGKGLPPEQTRRVFERFWRAEDARERDLGGSGLGLAIAQQLVNLHGGRIWVESEPDRTTFVFEIPAHST